MKAACLLTDSIYSLAVSDSGGIENEVLGLGFDGVGEIAGRDRTQGRVESWKCPLEPDLGPLELALDLEQVLALPVVAFLPPMS